jgi:hypothetical protein
MLNRFQTLLSNSTCAATPWWRPGGGGGGGGGGADGGGGVDGGGGDAAPGAEAGAGGVLVAVDGDALDLCTHVSAEVKGWPCSAALVWRCRLTLSNPR